MVHFSSLSPTCFDIVHFHCVYTKNHRCNAFQQIFMCPWMVIFNKFAVSDNSRIVQCALLLIDILLLLSFVVWCLPERFSPVRLQWLNLNLANHFSTVISTKESSPYTGHIIFVEFSLYRTKKHKVSKLNHIFLLFYTDAKLTRIKEIDWSLPQLEI